MEMNFNKLWRQKKQKPSILPSIARHLLDHHYHKGKNAGMLIAQWRKPPLLLSLCGGSLTLWAPQPAENSCPGDISIPFKKSRMSAQPQRSCLKKEVGESSLRNKSKGLLAFSTCIAPFKNLQNFALTLHFCQIKYNMAINYSFFILTERQKKQSSIINPNLHLQSEMRTKANTLGLFICYGCIA